MVGVAVDRLLAHDDEVGLLGLDQIFGSAAGPRHRRAGCRRPSTGTARSAPMARPGEAWAASLRTDGDQDHLAARAFVFPSSVRRSAASRAYSSNGFIFHSRPSDVTCAPLTLTLLALSGSATRLTGPESSPLLQISRKRSFCCEMGPATRGLLREVRPEITRVSSYPIVGAHDIAS